MTAGISGIGRLALRPLPASEMRHRAVTALHERIQLDLIDRDEFRSGAIALRYRPARATA